MSDANAWSIIVPGVVAPTVVAVYARWQQAAIRRQEEHRELRRVLDDAVKALHDADLFMQPLRAAWRRGEVPTDEKAREAAMAARATAHVLDRLVMRLGRDDPLTRACRDAVMATAAYRTYIEEGRRSGAPYPVPDDRLQSLRGASMKGIADFIETVLDDVGLSHLRPDPDRWRVSTSTEHSMFRQRRARS